MRFLIRLVCALGMALMAAMSAYLWWEFREEAYLALAQCAAFFLIFWRAYCLRRWACVATFFVLLLFAGGGIQFTPFFLGALTVAFAFLAAVIFSWRDLKRGV